MPLLEHKHDHGFTLMEIMIVVVIVVTGKELLRDIIFQTKCEECLEEETFGLELPFLDFHVVVLTQIFFTFSPSFHPKLFT